MLIGRSCYALHWTALGQRLPMNLVSRSECSPLASLVSVMALRVPQDNHQHCQHCAMAKLATPQAARSSQSVSLASSSSGEGCSDLR